MKNGNNINFVNFNSTGNPNLYCIQVDDSAWSTANWTNIDTGASFSENCYLNVNSVNIHTEINVYPNPTDGKFYISIEGLNNETTLCIIDVSGKTVLNESLSAEKTTKQVDLSNLLKGIYAVKVDNGEKVYIEKVVFN